MKAYEFTEQEQEAAGQMLLALGITDDAVVEGRHNEFAFHAMVLARALSVLWAKRGYGQSWRQHGYMGSILKSSIKVNRLMNLHWWNRPGTELEAEDTEQNFLDLVNYGVFGYQQWKDGEERGPN